MQAARVIVELRDGRWIAYFGDELYTAVFGPDASQALLNLLVAMGGGTSRNLDFNASTKPRMKAISSSWQPLKRLLFRLNSATVRLNIRDRDSRDRSAGRMVGFAREKHPLSSPKETFRQRWCYTPCRISRGQSTNRCTRARRTGTFSGIDDANHYQPVSTDVSGIDVGKGRGFSARRKELERRGSHSNRAGACS
ncbi:MAG: hypothetical protein JWP89_2185 [Schlesneria sp.]|nr:hypothetical protein [Schlesneria sp.]